MEQSQLEAVVKCITKTNKQIILAITGGGTEAIGDLLRHGNGSNVLLEAIVPYSCDSFVEFMGGQPDKFCNISAARSMAHAAFLRGYRLLTAKYPANQAINRLVAVAATASLSKEKEREGRQHVAHIAVETLTHQHVFSLKLEDKESRETEERAVANEIIAVLARACGVATSANSITSTGTSTADNLNLMQVTVGKKSKVLISKRKDCILGESSRLICPGSFNPFHDGHMRMIKDAEKRMGFEVDLEISVQNVDKPMVDLGSMYDRLKSIESFPRRTWLTKAPTFLEKAKLFPCSTFVVGSDTIQRIADPKYYNYEGEVDSVIWELRQLGIRFLVYPRIVDGSVLDIRSLTNFPPRLMDLLIFADDYSPTDFSSRQMRKEQDA